MRCVAFLNVALFCVFFEQTGLPITLQHDILHNIYAGGSKIARKNQQQAVMTDCLKA
jgi:hypothetical protein